MYDHYIAFDWAQSVVAVARLGKDSEKAHIFETSSKISEFKYLREVLACLDPKSELVKTAYLLIGAVSIEHPPAKYLIGPIINWLKLI